MLEMVRDKTMRGHLLFEKVLVLRLELLEKVVILEEHLDCAVFLVEELLNGGAASSVSVPKTVLKESPVLQNNLLSLAS